VCFRVIKRENKTKRRREIMCLLVEDKERKNENEFVRLFVLERERLNRKRKMEKESRECLNVCL